MNNINMTINRLLDFSKYNNKKSNNLNKKPNKYFEKILNIIISHKILLLSLFLLSSFQYVNNKIIEAYPKTILDNSYGGDIHLIPIYENNTEYHMLIISIFYNSVYLYKYDKFGNLVNTKIHNKPYHYAGYIKSINGESSFIASANEIPAFFNETTIVQLNGMPHCGRPGVGATSFRDSSIIISGGKDFKSQSLLYNFAILFYDNNFNLKTTKDVHPTDDPNLCLLTGDSAIIATEYLYYFLAFYAEKLSKNLIIKTMSYNEQINEFEEIKVVNTTDYYEVLSFDVDYIDYKNHNLILFCFHKNESICLYGNYEHENKQLIYDKKNEYKVPINCYYRQITMRVFKNNHSFYLICTPYTDDNSVKYDYFQLSIIRYEEGKPLFSEEGKDNIKIQIYNKNNGFIFSPSFVFFERKGPAIVYKEMNNHYSYGIAYFNPVSCQNSTINLFSYTKNTGLFSDYFEINYNTKINTNFILIEIPKEIQLYYEKNEMKINEEYSYRTPFNIITTEAGIYSIKYYPVSTDKYICELKVNVTLNNEKEEKNEEEVTCLKDYTKVNGECIPKKEIIFGNLTEYCKTACTDSNYLVCLKNLGENSDGAICICKNEVKGKKCHMSINEEINEKNKYLIKEIIKVKKVGIYKENKFYLYKEYYEIKQIFYRNNEQIISIENRKEEFEYNIIEDGKLITESANTYINLYNFK